MWICPLIKKTLFFTCSDKHKTVTELSNELTGRERGRELEKGERERVSDGQKDESLSRMASATGNSYADVGVGCEKTFKNLTANRGGGAVSRNRHRRNDENSCCHFVSKNGEEEKKKNRFFAAHGVSRSSFWRRSVDPRRRRRRRRRNKIDDLVWRRRRRPRLIRLGMSGLLCTLLLPQVLQLLPLFLFYFFSLWLFYFSLVYSLVLSIFYVLLFHLSDVNKP